MDIPPGPRQVVIVLEEPAPQATEPRVIEFRPYPVGPADPTCTYRREDIYGDDGR